MFKLVSITTLVLALLVLAGCGQDIENNRSAQSTGKLKKVITSFYPLYEIAKNIGGDRAEIKNLVPAGMEPHDYEPTPQDILNIIRADLVIVNGAGLEPWLDRLRGDLQKKGIVLLEMAQSMQKSGVTTDPHFWLDPTIYKEEISLVSDTFEQLDGVHSGAYIDSIRSLDVPKWAQPDTLRYMQKIEELHNVFQQGLANCESRTLVTSHAAFGYLAKRYNLEIIPVAGFSPEAEVSAKRLAELIQIVKNKKVQYIFTETLVNPKIAETLAKEAGLKTLTLNPLEGLTESEILSGKNYVSVMGENLKNLQIALNCK